LAGRQSKSIAMNRLERLLIALAGVCLNSLLACSGQGQDFDTQLRLHQPLITKESIPVPAPPLVPAGRVELFNGKDLSGWAFCLQSNAGPANTFTVNGGVIHCTGRPNGYMRTEKNYQDYRLTVEWRFVKVAPKADNTGIFLHITPPDGVWPTCFECQGQHNHQGDLRLNGNATCKGHEPATDRGIPTSIASNENPVGEWNKLLAECSGRSIKLFINGKLMNGISDCSVSSGAIGIQSEGGEIEVRQMFLEPLTR
jgi:hypothetical protein